MTEKHYVSFDELPIVLDVEQLAAALRVGRNTAYGLVKNGKIKSIRVGRQIRVAKEDVKRFLMG